MRSWVGTIMVVVAVVVAYSTFSRKRPVGGAVGPAAERLRAARIAAMSFGAEAVRSALNEGADQVANHVMQKAVRGDTVDQQIIGCVPAGLGDAYGGCSKARAGCVR